MIGEWLWKNPFATRIFIPYTGDPNDLYREYLEQHVGKQSLYWDWTIDSIERNLIEIVFLRDAMLFSLRY